MESGESIGPEIYVRLDIVKDLYSHWSVRFDLFFITVFSVFLLPFMLPPAVIEGVSAANAAGFNNKLAAVAAALCSLLVFALEYKWPEVREKVIDQESGALSLLLVCSVTLACGLYISALSYLFAFSGARFADESYFIDQIGKYLDCGRMLYEQIEFSYGPLLFYGPVWIKTLFSPFHLSLFTAYYTALVLEHCIGILLVAYILNHLTIARRWKTFFFLLAALQTYPFSIGLNYTHFRFLLPIAFLLWAGGQRNYKKAAVCVFVGEFLSLSISAEMGFAFGAASTAYGLYFIFAESAVWILTTLSPMVSAMVFIFVVGNGYLRMLKLFAHGIYNLIVEPLPYMLVFLLALIWLVPRHIANLFHRDEEQAPRLAALYLFALALLPVALGRADPAHVYFNGFAVLVLSLSAITGMRLRSQVVWMSLLALAMLYTAALDVQSAEPRIYGALLNGLHNHPDSISAKKIVGLARRIAKRPDPPISDDSPVSDNQADIDRLQAIIGMDAVATPISITYRLQSSLKRSKQYIPSFYDFTTAVLDRSAEENFIQEFNKAGWALLPNGTEWIYFETPETTARDLGMRLPYKTLHMPYKAGVAFAENLAVRWQPVATVGSYELYRHKDEASFK